MKRILIFGMNQNPGGMESFIMSYFRKIDRSRFQFDFLTNCAQIAYEDEILRLGGQVYKICARSQNYKRYRQDLTAFFRQHAGEYQAVWMNTCSLANIDYLKMAKAYGIPCRIIHSHNSQNMDSRLRGVLHWLSKRVIEKYATAFWACSRLAGEFFFSPAVINGPHYQEIHNAIDCRPYLYDETVRDAVRQELGIEDKLVVGHVGRLHFQKNQSFLLEIFRAVKDDAPNAVLLLVGQGEDEAMLRQKAEALGITDSVQFLGVRGDVPRLMQAMDVFALPSLFEGLPVVLVETQAAGLPAVVADTVSPASRLTEDLVTFLSLSQPPAAWAKTLLGCRVPRTDRQADIAAAGYDIDTQVRELESLLEALI